MRGGGDEYVDDNVSEEATEQSESSERIESHEDDRFIPVYSIQPGQKKEQSRTRKGSGR